MQGGDSDSLGKQNYHPFYITSDPNGGYGNKIESERGEPGVFLKISTCETTLHNEQDKKSSKLTNPDKVRAQERTAFTFVDL